MKRVRILMILGAALLSAAGTGCQRERSAQAAPRSETRSPRPVRLTVAQGDRLPRTIVATGTLAADEHVVTGFKIAGRVSELTVDLGSPVRKGQVLARLDPTDFRLRVEQTEAALRQVRAQLGLDPQGSDERVDPEQTATVREARAVLDEARLHRDRMARLSEKEFVTRAELDSAVARVLVAEGRYQAALEEIRNRQALLAERRSALALARQQLADAVLLAPIEGAVRERQASVGQFLAAGAPVVSIVRIHPLRLRLAVSERDAPSVQPGQAVQVRVEGDATVHAGRVARLSPAIEEQNRTLTIEAEVGNREGRLRPGAFARAEIVIEADRPAVLVPASAVLTFAGIEKLIGVKEGKAVEQRIRTGRRVGDRVEVLDGIAAGDAVVAEPGNLTSGQPVTVVQ